MFTYVTVLWCAEPAFKIRENSDIELKIGWRITKKKRKKNQLDGKMCDTVTVATRANGSLSLAHMMALHSKQQQPLCM